MQPWHGVRAATKPGPRCAQDAGLGSPASDAEDCLYLNVTTPLSARNRPVLIWLHGGSFTSGAGSGYGVDQLVRKGSVVVTVNYRLGAFGYFGFPGLAGSGAFGLKDQQKALEWVQRNIRQFGGNPHNVTLFGASAGGLSTCAQLRPLFWREKHVRAARWPELLVRSERPYGANGTLVPLDGPSVLFAPNTTWRANFGRR